MLEAADEPGGGVRSGALTLPGFLHDVGSAVHPLALSSPFFRAEPLAAHGLEWVHPTIPLAHPLDGRPAAALHRSIAETAATLSSRDGSRYRALIAPFVDRWTELCDDILSPTPLAPLHVPAHPLLFARFASRGLVPAALLARWSFAEEPARALFGGLAAHSLIPLTAPGSSAFAIVLGAAGHAVGWPIPRGGAGSLTAALVRLLASHGGTVETNAPVHSLSDISADADAILLDLTPRQVVIVAGASVSPGERRALERYRYGPGAFKIDWALSEPIPWRDPECARAGTVHLGGTLSELVASEAAPWQDRHADRPYVLLVQPSLFDATRAPPGQHTAWGYCHVPNGSDLDMLGRIEAQVERFAPGFADVVRARGVMPPSRLQAYNANLVGGDVGGGANVLKQMLFRPTVRANPYRLGRYLVAGGRAARRTPVYLCSSSTPPGGGVHGMSGYHAATVVLRDHARR